MATLNKRLRGMLEDRLGQKVEYSNDCEYLAREIKRVTGESLGNTTVKRFFGFANDPVMAHRASTRFNDRHHFFHRDLMEDGEIL